LIGLATLPEMAYLGAALVGFGYSLAFPRCGVEAVRRVPAASRGAAMGAYVAFLDITLALTGPLLGAVAAASSLDSVFLVAATAVAGAAVVALGLWSSPRRTA
jgi:predicted MFS family arabinose efflux permease